jgi:hypothetical protein
MSKKENGRMLLNNITLIEYGTEEGGNQFFLQSGIAGFYASGEELRDLHALLSYYYNIDAIHDTIISTP